MTAYYNEIDPGAAAWLRELIKADIIAPGEVDERDIREVKPNDLRGFTQCHFFAGIGVWSYALRLAGWPDDREVWTGSCPCQPFSVAGKRKGEADERHLWPDFFRLIAERKPRVVFGEQVAGKDGIAWLDTVSADLEREGYACGPVVFPACGVGAPHRRERLWFVADTEKYGNRAFDRESVQGFRSQESPRGYCVSSRLANSEGERSSHRRSGAIQSEFSTTCSLGDSECSRSGRDSRTVYCQETQGDSQREQDGRSSHVVITSGPVNGFWQDAEWIYCRDGKYRAIEPGTFPLAHGAPCRVGRLRGYGNAIVAEAAAQVIGAYMDISPTPPTPGGEKR